MRLEDFRGKVVLVDFWATWCGPCQSSIPVIQSLFEKYRSAGFTVVGVSVDQNIEPIPGFLKAFGMTYPVLLDVETEVQQAYGARGIPTMVLLDRELKVRKFFQGWPPGMGPVLNEEIKSLLTE